MSKVPRDGSKGNRDQWWYVQSQISGLDASPTEKYCFTLIHRHTNQKTGYAWASQAKLAAEMGVNVRTVRRIFHKWGKRRRVIVVQRIRKDKNPSEQHNHYRLDAETMKAWQRPTEHRTRTSFDSASEHRTPMSSVSHEHRTPVSTNTGHSCPRTQDTHVRQGLEVSGNEESGNEKRARASQRAQEQTHARANKPHALLLNETESLLSEKLEQFLRIELPKTNPVAIERVIDFVRTAALAQNRPDSLDENSIEKIIRATASRLHLQTGVPVKKCLDAPGRETVPPDTATVESIDAKK